MLTRLRRRVSKLQIIHLSSATATRCLQTLKPSHLLQPESIAPQPTVERPEQTRVVVKSRSCNLAPDLLNLRRCESPLTDHREQPRSTDCHNRRRTSNQPPSERRIQGNSYDYSLRLRLDDLNGLLRSLCEIERAYIVLTDCKTTLPLFNYRRPAVAE